MCRKKILQAAFLIFLLSGTVFVTGCTGDFGESDSSLQDNAPKGQADQVPDTEGELRFMKDILAEMKNQGKDISEPLETYRIARIQARNNDNEGFSESLSLFYDQCNRIMTEINTVYTGNKTVI